MADESDRMTLRLPMADSAALDFLAAKRKLMTGQSTTKTDIIRALVRGFLSGDFQLGDFQDMDVPGELAKARSDQ